MIEPRLPSGVAITGEPRTAYKFATLRLGLNGKVVAGASIVAVAALVAVLAPVIAPDNPLAQDVTNRLASPSPVHLLGTDSLGRDLLSRLIYGTRADLTVGILGALLPAMLGTFLGSIAGFYGGWRDAIVMRSADLVQAFPVYILIIALVFALGPGVRSILVAFTVTAWVTYARLIRGEMLRVRDLDFVRAARGGGLPNWRILIHHVLRNSIRQTIVYFPTDIVFAILALAAFSFLGLGISQPTPEWGAMISEGQEFLRTNWWMATVPGLVIVVVGIGLTLIADGLDDILRH